MAKVIEETKTIQQGMVMYTDGGCRPTSRGNTGWGIHGYLYEEIEPKKGSGNPDVYLTPQGYVKKLDIAKEVVNQVKPIVYFDGYGSSTQEGTNNTAEIKATTAALEKACEYVLTKLMILTDSEYVKKGITEWSSVWIKRNWIKLDGKPVPNSQEWIALLDKYNTLLSRGVNVEINWIKGHSGDLGNDSADQLATIGVFGSIKRINKAEIKTSAADGYWKSEVQRHPFIGNRRMYFNTITQANTRGEYYLGEHGKDDDHIGKKTADGALCVVQLIEPDDVLEDIRNHVCELNDGANTIAMVRLDEVYRPSTYKTLSNYGCIATEKSNSWSTDLQTLDKEPLVKQLVPPLIANRAIDSLQEIKLLLEEYKKNPVESQALDLTDVLYDRVTVEKKSKEPITTFKLKSEHAVGLNSLNVDFNVKDSEGKEISLKIILTLGIDILSRNNLKRLEDLSPVVKLIVWKYSENVYKYATIIESKGSYGIWVGAYSNIVFVKKS